MLKKCKNPRCNKEQEMTGKQEFCDKKCRNAYNYALKSGKIIKPEKKVIKPDEKPDRVLIGTVVKVTTTTSKKKVVHIEFDLIESEGVSNFLYLPAMVHFFEETDASEKETEETDDLMD